jgi:hypothetical protein
LSDDIGETRNERISESEYLESFPESKREKALDHAMDIGRLKLNSIGSGRHISGRSSGRPSQAGTS